MDLMRNVYQTEEQQWSEFETAGDIEVVHDSRLTTWYMDELCLVPRGRCCGEKGVYGAVGVRSAA